MEEGEEPVLTLAEETKREIRREERRKRKEEEFRIAKDTCKPFQSCCILGLTMLDKPTDDPEAVGDPYKTLFIARLVSRCGRLADTWLTLSQVKVSHGK